MDFETLKLEHPKAYTLIEVIIGIIAGAILLGMIFIVSKPIRADFSRRNDILNFLNKGKTNNISEETIKEYKELKALSEQTERWDVSPVIFDYLNKIEASAQYVHSKGSNRTSHYKVATQLIEPKQKTMKYGYLGEDCSFLTGNIPEVAVENGSAGYMQGIIAELENIFIHDSPYPTEGWYITVDVAKEKGSSVNDNQWILKLPCNCYANFKSTNTQSLNNLYTDVKVGKSKNNKYTLTLSYTNRDTKDKDSVDTILTFNHKDWFHKKDMTISLYNVIFRYQTAEFNIYSDEQSEEEFYFGRD